MSLVLLVSSSLWASAGQSKPELKLDGEKIENLTGLKGKLGVKEGVFKVSQPRTDVKVSVDRWTIPPFMGLTSWAAFTLGRKNKLMVMGDLVLFQDEVNPVMSVLFENGIDVTALHNHFFYDDPKVFFMHISGEGELAGLAGGLRAALDQVTAIRLTHPSPVKNFDTETIPSVNTISSRPLEAVFGQPGESKDGMFKETIGRKAQMACGCEAGKDMGVNTWAAFAGSDENAVVDGDFAVTENELQKVLRSLRSRNINIVAIHHHMTEEKPRILFLHYFGRGKAIDLANGVKAALETQALK